MAGKRQIIGSALWQVLQILRTLWLRVTLIAMLSVLAAGLTVVLGPLIPEGLVGRLGEDSIRPILSILASSMLAVTTFSLNVMVASQQAAASLATPRAHRLILEDTTTHTVLATFMGAFLFALVALLLYPTGAFDGGSPVVLFGTTVVVAMLVVLAMLRWIDHLTKLGGIDAVLDLVEGRAEKSLDSWRAPPCLGGRPLTPDLRQAPHPIRAERSGYVQRIDVTELQDWAQARDTIIQIVATPGASVVAGDTLIRCFTDPGDDAQRLARMFHVETTRTFDQDVRYGLMVLAEIGTRALSPGVNDPGTAIEVIARLERLLVRHGSGGEPVDDPELPRLFIVPVTAVDMIQDAYAAMARDGAGMIEVAMRLSNALDRLENGGADLASAARGMRRRLHDHARQALPTEADKERLGVPG